MMTPAPLLQRFQRHWPLAHLQQAWFKQLLLPD